MFCDLGRGSTSEISESQQTKQQALSVPLNHSAATAVSGQPVPYGYGKEVDV